MVKLRPREKKLFNGFTKAEIEKMESLLKEPGDKPRGREFYMKLAKRFNCCNDRAGKPALKWAEVETWFQNQQQSDRVKSSISVKSAEKLSAVPEACSNILQNCTATKGKNVPDLSELEFEARSATDGAWYDVEKFLTCRSCPSVAAEVLVRYEGFGAENDEWVNINKDVRERSLPLEHTECGKVKVGDLVVCFQESGDLARYFDAHIVEIQRKMHDIRGCRCLFLIKYDHDNTKARKSEVEQIMLPSIILNRLGNVDIASRLLERVVDLFQI